MADRSKIEWCDATWNPVTGCTPVSEGCENCYAKRIYERFNDGPFSQITLHYDRMRIPQRWRKPRRIFVCSMSDLFHKDIPYGHISMVWANMAFAQQHKYFILTKRPERMARIVTGAPKYVWLGGSIENQKTADRRVWLLLSTPAHNRFVSIEPMLGPIVLPKAVWARLDWIICGCESGPNRRPMNLNWVRSLRDQAVEAGVPFFLKQADIGDGKVTKTPPIDGKRWVEIP